MSHAMEIPIAGTGTVGPRRPKEVAVCFQTLGNTGSPDMAGDNN